MTPEIIKELEAAAPGKNDFVSARTHPELMRKIFDELIKELESGKENAKDSKVEISSNKLIE